MRPASAVPFGNGIDDAIEAHRDRLRPISHSQPQEHERRRHFARNRDETWSRKSSSVLTASRSRDEQRPAAASQRSAGAQDAVVLHQQRDCAVADFREFVVRFERGVVEILDVFELNAHGRRVVKQSVRQRGEDVRVVRTRRICKRQSCGADHASGKRGKQAVRMVSAPRTPAAKSQRLRCARKRCWIFPALRSPARRRFPPREGPRSLPCFRRPRRTRQGEQHVRSVAVTRGTVMPRTLRKPNSTSRSTSVRSEPARSTTRASSGSAIALPSRDRVRTARRSRRRLRPLPPRPRTRRRCPH